MAVEEINPSGFNADEPRPLPPSNSRKDATRSEDEKSETAATLSEFAVPLLYQRNGFRVLELPADATAREISRRKQTVEKAMTHGVPVPPGPGRYFPLTPPADQFAVREAMQRLSDPERRLVDELFWFWPHRQGEAASDSALSRLREGKDKEAEGVWLEQESEHSESSVSTHNLALLYHFRALETELGLLQAGPGPTGADGTAKLWDKSFRRWRLLSENEGFWSRLTARIRELEDPRLTTGTTRRIRATLPSALLSICGQLVLQAIETGLKENASRLVEIINKSGFPEAEIKQGLQKAIEPVRARIKNLCKAAELAAKNDPVHADNTCRQLLSTAKPFLEGLDCLLPADHPSRELAHDDVAERALACQVAFARKTENWKLSAALLESALPVASSSSLRKKLQEQIEIVRKRADTNDDFRGEGYFDAPAPLLEQLEKAGTLAGKEAWDPAISCLEDLLAGKSGVKVSADHLGLVNKALAYCLGCRAARRLNEAISEWNDFTPSVITTIQGRAKEIDNTSWMCAGIEKVPQYTRCPCMACGTVIFSGYSVVKWTFKKEKGPVNLIICANCAGRLRSERESYQAKIKSAVHLSAQDYVDAAELDPANKFVHGQLDHVRKMCADEKVAMPKPRGQKARAAKSAAATAPQAKAAKPAAVVTAGGPATARSKGAPGRGLGYWSLGLGILAALGCINVIFTMASLASSNSNPSLFLLSAIGPAFWAIPAIICGHLNRRRSKQGGGKRASKAAIIGLVLGYGVLVALIVSIASFSSSSEVRPTSTGESAQSLTGSVPPPMNQVQNPPEAPKPDKTPPVGGESPKSHDVLTAEGPAKSVAAPKSAAAPETPSPEGVEKAAEAHLADDARTAREEAEAANPGGGESVEERVKSVKTEYEAQGYQVVTIIAIREGPEDAIFGLSPDGNYFKATATGIEKVVGSDTVPETVKNALKANLEQPLVWTIDRAKAQEVAEAVDNHTQPQKVSDYDAEYQKLLNNARLSVFGKIQGTVVDTLSDPTIPQNKFRDDGGKFAPAKFAFINLESQRILDSNDLATLKAAANQGYAGAAFKLGRLYEAGQVVEQDYAMAATWYRQAADLYRSKK